MNVEAMNVQNSIELQMRKTTERVTDARKLTEYAAQEETVEKKQVQPEELLQQIKDLTEDGMYSVQIATDERTSGFVVKIVDRESNDVIRQVPPEELLEVKALLADLRGNIIDTEG